MMAERGKIRCSLDAPWRNLSPSVEDDDREDLVWEDGLSVEMGQVKDLILLVGHNPMPNFIVARMLQPRRIFWLYSRNGTSEEQQRLVQVLRQYIAGCEHVPCEVADASDPQAIRAAMVGIQPGAWLNYTGGTKAMAVQAYAYWKERLGGEPGKASYLDGRSGYLRRDDGRADRIPELSVHIDDVLTLHGLVRDANLTLDPDACIQEPETARILAAVLDDYKNTRDKEDTLATKLYRACQHMRNTKVRDGKVKIDTPVSLPLPSEIMPSFARQPNWPVGAPPRRIWTWGVYLTGGWFEDWATAVIQQVNIGGNLGLEIATGVRPKPERNGSQSELDIVIVRNYKVYVMSITTEGVESALVKSKCYEVKNRAESIGGGLAKSAVVCLLRPEQAHNVAAAVRSPWQEQSTQVRVFDRSHVEAWFKDQDYSELVRWLTDED